MMERDRKNGGDLFPPGKKRLFLSGDWGTSSLRVRLTDADSLEVTGEDHSGIGIREAFFSWERARGSDQAPTPIHGYGQTGAGKDPGGRISFYLGIIRGVLRKIENKLGLSLEGIPLVLSGMASSSAGMLELPYKEIPFNVYSEDLITEWIPAAADSSNPVLLISGLRSGEDVMRGEETQLIGCLAGAGDTSGLYIFPGTHSKHILVKDGAIAAFSTFMTGEIFGLLAEKSLLAGSVQKNPEEPEAHHWDSFRQGVKAAADANFLQAAFRTRINDLFGRLSKTANFYYLSGLLIGTELQSLPDNDKTSIYLCCGHAMKDHYEKALETAAICKRVHIFPAGWVEMAAIRGQWAILSGVKPY